MIDAYVLNLDRHAERKTELINNIELNGINKFLNINFVKGIDGNNLTDEEKTKFKICPRWFDFKLKTGITRGEIGCALSHYKAWKEFYDSGKEHAIFFEDDIYFKNDNFEKNLKYLLSYPQDTDMIYILRKSLFEEKDCQQDIFKYFQEIKASYWLCSYLLTRNCVEKILNSNYLENLIVVDEFLPILYDQNYLQMYKKYYNISIKAYSLKREYSFINLKDNAFYDSSTFHSNYYEFDSSIIAITSDKYTSNSSISRFIKSCRKFSIQPKIIKITNLINELSDIHDDKYIFLLNCNYCFFINNPNKLIVKEEKDLYYSSFSDMNSLLENYESNSLYFFGKKYLLLDIILNSNKMHIINSQQFEIFNILKSDIDETIEDKDSLILNGIDNVLLLNKYENYSVNKVLNNYGYKNINNKCDYNFKIRVNVMIYSYYNIECLNILKNIDYPKELLDINIYTLFELSLPINEIKIHKISELEAYKEMYKYYLNYDYMWIIYSNTIITEPNVLKDLIDSEKQFVAGLVVRKDTLHSNFWGKLTKKGWYSRSHDYIDILNRKKINIWNVPYVNSNILINKNIFEKYDLFKDNNFEDVDMQMCHNMRNYNESIYLTNQKLYGYILPEDSKNLYIDYKNNLNINNWTKNKIFSPEYLKFYDDGDISILKEFKTGTDIWCFPFFSTEFCDFLIKVAETNGNWSGGVYNKGALDKRIGAIENVPTQDIHLKDLGLEKFWLEIINIHFKKIMSKLYHYKTKDYNIAFIVKYDAERGQTSLEPHHDASVYTTNIALSTFSDYEGGGVKFHSKNITFYNKNKGWVCIHPGRVTHYHEAHPITKGKRYILVSFNN